MYSTAIELKRMRNFCEYLLSGMCHPHKKEYGEAIQTIKEINTLCIRLSACIHTIEQLTKLPPCCGASFKTFSLELTSHTRFCITVLYCKKNSLFKEMSPFFYKEGSDEENLYVIGNSTSDSKDLCYPYLGFSGIVETINEIHSRPNKEIEELLLIINQEKS